VSYYKHVSIPRRWLFDFGNWLWFNSLTRGWRCHSLASWCVRIGNLRCSHAPLHRHYRHQESACLKETNDG